MLQVYRALAQIHLARTMALPRRLVWRARAARLTRQLQKLARAVPATHLHRVILLQAEFLAAKGKTAAAVIAFEKGVALARDADQLHDAALGLERAGLFYLGLGARDQARALLQRAIEAYHVWGGTE